MKILLTATLGLALIAIKAHAGCGEDPAACQMPDGEYHITLPDAATPPVVMFLHGAGGKGKDVIGNTGMVDELRRRGYAVIAPTGGRASVEGNGAMWNFFPGWEGRDETDFLKRVLADAAARFGVDPKRTLLAGFSAGGFMVNYLACAEPDSFSAYAPVSGGFWRPEPEACAGPVKLFHTHGWRDATVPLEGRSLRNGRFQQGDIFAGLEIWRSANKCTDQAPTAFGETGAFLRRKWENCAPGSALELALFPGGHGIPAGWADMALDWFEAVTRP